MNFDKMLEDLAANVNAAIANAGYRSINEFAKEKGLAISTVRRIANKQESPSLQAVAQIAEAAGMPLADLLGIECRKF